MGITNLVRDIGRDLVRGKNIDAYVVTIIGIALIVIEFLGDVGIELQLTALLTGMTLLVFKSTRDRPQRIDLDTVLQDRHSYGAFHEFIQGGRMLDVYAPSASTILANNGADIKQELLTRGGRMRVILQDPHQHENVRSLQQQLDQMSDILLSDIQRSLFVLKRLKDQGHDVDYKLLSYSPGFSLVMLDKDNKKGQVNVEFFGYTNEDIIDRMHININRQNSQYWLEYWGQQFEVMWKHARDVVETDYNFL